MPITSDRLLSLEVMNRRTASMPMSSTTNLNIRSEALPSRLMIREVDRRMTIIPSASHWIDTFCVPNTCHADS